MAQRGTSGSIVFIISACVFLMLAPQAFATQEIEIFRQSLRDLDLSSNLARPKLSDVYSNVRDELPKQAQALMDSVVENAKNEQVPSMESKISKGNSSQDIMRLSFKGGGEELVLEIDITAPETPLRINGKVMPVNAWWSERDFNQFLISLPAAVAVTETPTRLEFFAKMFLGSDAVAESIEERARNLACKTLAPPRVCSEANPKYLEKLRAIRKKMEMEIQREIAPVQPVEASIPVHKSVGASVTPTPSPQRILAAVVGMSIVWKSFYKNKNSTTEAPVPLPMGAPSTRQATTPGPRQIESSQ